MIRFIFSIVTLFALVLPACAASLELNVSNIPPRTKSIYIPLNTNHQISCPQTFNNTLTNVYCKATNIPGKRGVFVSSQQASLQRAFTIEIEGHTDITSDSHIYSTEPQYIDQSHISLSGISIADNTQILKIQIHTPTDIPAIYLPIITNIPIENITAMGRGDTGSIAYRYEKGAFEMLPIGTETIMAGEHPIQIEISLPKQISIDQYILNVSPLLSAPAYIHKDIQVTIKKL